jgi:enamine deaminase RidA (YjgF/YER057c/UK114 family)
MREAVYRIRRVSNKERAGAAGRPRRGGRDGAPLLAYSTEGGSMERLSSGSPFEPVVGYSRAVRAGSVIEIAGTVAADENGKAVAVGDPYQQTRFILSRILAYVARAGGRPEDVVRTRMFVTDISKWKEIGKAHGEVFGEIRPVTTMVEVKALISSEYLVEIEATAIIE